MKMCYFQLCAIPWTSLKLAKFAVPGCP